MMKSIIVTISAGIVVGVVYYILKNIPPNGGFGGRMA